MMNLAYPRPTARVRVDFPMLTRLIQEDWNRVVGGQDSQLPRQGFLIAYRSSAAAAGRLAEDLLCHIVLDRLLAEYWPAARVLTAQDAVDPGLLLAPSPGGALRRPSHRPPRRLLLAESKCTIGRWSHLRPMGLKALRQLTITARANPMVTAAVLLACSLNDHRIGIWHQARAELLDAPAARRVAAWKALHHAWKPDTSSQRIG